MGYKTQWNNPALFDYVDRYVAITRGQPDPFGYTVEHENTGFPIDGQIFIAAMWDTYRAVYPMPPYGANPTPPGLSNRIPGTGRLILGTGSFY
jgi:hypothetical protein